MQPMSNGMPVEVTTALLALATLSLELRGVAVCRSFVDAVELFVLSDGEATVVVVTLCCCCCSFCAAKLRKTRLIEETCNLNRQIMTGPCANVKIKKIILIIFQQAFLLFISP